jgi:hypothetical protein
VIGIRFPELGRLLPAILGLLLMAGRYDNVRPPREAYGALTTTGGRLSTVTIPFTLTLLRAHRALVRSPFMNTYDSHWVPVDCRRAAGSGQSAGFACGLYVSPAGQLLGGNNEYRYALAPDRSSLALRAVPDTSEGVAFSIDVNVGYSVRLRGMSGVHSCGDPTHDYNSATRKKDYLHFHLHETIRLQPTPDYGLRASFAHTLVPDARCRLRVLLPVSTDLTNAIGGIESRELARAEARLKRKLEDSAPRLHAAASAAWKRLGRPYPVALKLSAYVVLRPRTLAMLPFVGDGLGDRLRIRGGLRIGISPEVVTNGASVAPVPLPRFRTVSNSSKPDLILANATLGYASANAILRKRMIGQRLGTGLLRAIDITNVTVYPTTVAGVAKLAVRLDYRGAVRGSLYAWGTPRYDARLRAISLPDLRVTPARKGFVGRLAAPLLQQRELIESIRAQTAAELTSQFRNLRAALIRTYGGTVADNVSVRGAVRQVNLQTILPSRPGITAAFAVSGSIRVDAAFDAQRFLEPRAAQRATAP